MNDRYERREIHFFGPAELTAEEEYLESMAQKGWLLRTVIGYVYVFKKAAPQKLKYAVELFPKIRSTSKGLTSSILEYIDLCGEAGFDHVCTWKNKSVFITTGEQSLPIMTDEREKLRLVERNLVSEAAVLAVFIPLCIHALLSLFSDGFWVFSDNITVFFMPFLLIGILITFMYTFIYGSWVQKQKTRLKNGKPLRFLSLKQQKCVSRWSVIPFIGFCIFWIFFNIAVLGAQHKYSAMRNIIWLTLVVAAVTNAGHLLGTRIGFSWKWILKMTALGLLGFCALFLSFTEIKSGYSGPVASSCSILAGKTALQRVCPENGRLDEIILFETPFDFLREAYLSQDGYSSSAKPVYDTAWDADTGTAPDGVKYVFYGDSVIRIPAKFCMDTQDISLIRDIADKPPYTTGSVQKAAEE